MDICWVTEVLYSLLQFLNSDSLDVMDQIFLCCVLSESKQHTCPVLYPLDASTPYTQLWKSLGTEAPPIETIALVEPGHW